MNNEWHSISDYNITSSGTISAETAVKDVSPWFHGHFPNDPVLPGVAELTMVYDLIKKYEKKKGNDINISSMRRIKFRKIIKPNEKLSIAIQKNEKDQSFSFEIKSDNEIACTGVIIVQ